MAAREILMAVIESSYGTAKTTPSLGTDSCYFRLDQDNAFTGEMRPMIETIPYGGGMTVAADDFSDADECGGELNVLLYPGIWSELLLKWAITPVNTGRTAPWTTTDASSLMPVGDLASMSFYHAFQLPSGIYERNRYSGAKCTRWRLSASSDQRAWRLSASFVAIKSVGNARDASTDPDATEFPLPAETDYPIGPYLFSHLGSGTGTVKIGTTRTFVRGLTIGAENSLNPSRYLSRYIQTCLFTGRSSTAEAVLRTDALTDRDAFRALTAQDSEFKVDNGTKTVKVDFHNANTITNYQRDLASGREYAHSLTVRNKFSQSQATDLTLTTT
jgi:hypothetical protein